MGRAGIICMALLPLLGSTAKAIPFVSEMLFVFVIYWPIYLVIWIVLLLNNWEPASTELLIFWKWMADKGFQNPQ
jgi:hypothetical protein